MIKKAPILLIVFALGSCVQETTSKENALFIKDVTIINTDWGGNSSDDIKNGYVSIRNGKIDRLGTYADSISIAPNTRIIDGKGKFLVPGLIDGFAVINNQSYANAFLLSGVTSIIGVESPRRGALFEKASPSPSIFTLGEVGDTIQNAEQIKNDFHQSSKDGNKVMLLMYKLTPDLVQHSLELASEHEMASIGELGYTDYKTGMDLGVQAFVHTTRYSMDIASREMANAVAGQPFSNELNSPKWKYYQFLSSLDASSPDVIHHARNVGKSDSYLMPTLSLLYLDIPNHSNPWEHPISKLIDPKDINNPANEQTGNHDYKPEVQQAYTKLALKELELENQYYTYGAKYLTGSGCDVWGTMPGISLHTELELLQRVGLTNRELLASATSNFSEAFGWNKGEIKPGFDADLLLLNKNPIDSIIFLNTLETIILNGKVIDPSKLKNQLNE